MANKEIQKASTMQYSIFSTLLEINEDDVFYGIDYSKLVAVLIKGWQMHEKEVAELKDTIQLLSEN